MASKSTDSWILRSCSDQVQRLVPVESLHVRTADGLEELAVQLPSISSAYCPDTSLEFGLWKSFWRRSYAKMPQVTYNLSDLIRSQHYIVNIQLSPDWLTTRLAPVQTCGPPTAEPCGQGGGRLVQATAKPKGAPAKAFWNPQKCILPPTYRPVFFLPPGATQRCLPVSKLRTVGSAACRGPSYDPQA